MSKKKIKIEIECKNIAPLITLKENVVAGSLKYGVFANNGSGKTFISRMFRLTEKIEEELYIDELGNSSTDKLITRGRSSANFKFKIIDNNNNVVENICIEIERGKIPDIPDTNYIYHTFNQDYVEKNIRTMNFEKDSEVEGYILGKINIDLNDEETLLKTKMDEDKKLTNQIASEISNYVNRKIKPIRDINRIKEFKNLKPKEIFKSVYSQPKEISKSLDLLLQDYNKIKSVPETLAKIKEINSINIDSEFVTSVIEDCKEAFVLSDIAEEFKFKVKSKQLFIENGLELIEKDKCPFCEQNFEDAALKLIDNYNDYLQDREALTLKRFETYQLSINSIKDVIEDTIEYVESRALEYDKYKNNYLPSLSEKSLDQIDVSSISTEILELEKLIKEQQKDISKSVVVVKDYISSIAKAVALVNATITANNFLIKEANKKLDKISDESLKVRREICNAAFNHLVSENKTNFKNVTQLRNDIKELKEEIRLKKQHQKISKKDKMIDTIRNVLKCFFSNKYSLDPETFRLTFNNDVLGISEANHILSDGEKTIVAFAYFVGDVHLKVNSEEEYKKLFFVIDDPISSMDFDHVYTLCGVLRDLKEIFDMINQERLFIFTHNSEFMRILIHHRIISKQLILKKGKLHQYSINSTVPYINHLIDLSKYMTKIQKFLYLFDFQYLVGT